ncbi:MAG: RNA polymerase-binding protein DksA [Desulfovibrionaceae bacterium]
MEAKDLQFFREMLQGMLDDTMVKSQETLEDMTESGEIYADPADRATAESDRAFTLRLRDRERKLVRKIQQAIQRIDDGEFGICSECGDDISIPRLKARPMTTLCIACKSKQEEEESVRGD